MGVLEGFDVVSVEDFFAVDTDRSDDRFWRYCWGGSSRVEWLFGLWYRSYCRWEIYWWGARWCEELRTSRTGRTHLTGGVEGTFCVWVTWRDEGNNVYFVGKSHVSALALLGLRLRMA